MTERLYYTDPYRTEFDALVQRLERRDAGSVVVLDRTAFYPSSGGQPFDIGTLGGARVTDVIDLPDGAIGHVLDGDLEVGRSVHGVIDWPRRFDHMQQHTGQHVLSAAFDRLHAARTESFHLGSECSTIDLAREVTAAEIASAEADANRIVWVDREVTIRFVGRDEAAGVRLRKDPVKGDPAGTEMLRLIEIADVDRSACGGTHVARTGAIGIIGVVSWERFRGGTRVTFVCGGRALGCFRRYRETVAGSIRLLSVLPEELPKAIERVQAESKDLRRTIKGLQEQLARYEAVALAARGERVGGDRMLVVEAVAGWDAAGLKALASSLTANPGFVVALLSITTPALIVIARSADLDLDASAAVRDLTTRFGGRGGGRPEMAQAGGLTGAVGDIVQAARDTLARAIQRA